MLGREVLVIVAAVLLIAPAAAADHVEEIHEVGTEATDEVGDLYVVVQGHAAPENDVNSVVNDFICPIINPFCLPGSYQTQANTQLWEETNACDGLQRSVSDCTGDGSLDDPDTHHATLGCVQGSALCGSPVWATP